jgi:hypothetical protein
MAQTTYCNATTDLYRAYPRIEEFREYKTVRGWVLHSGSIYKVGGTGYVSAVFENNLPLTAAASAVAVTAGTYYYDSDADVLYLAATSGLPTASTNIYKVGEDWDSLKSWAVTQAGAEVDTLLDGRFPRPIPESPDGSTTARYDVDLTRAAAKFAVAFIASRREPMRTEPEPNTAQSLYDEGRKIIDEYNKGDRHFSWEQTKDEIGGFIVRAETDNTGDGILQVRGSHDAWDDAFWRVKITTAGAVGTAEYQYSTDNGSTYNGTDLTTSRTWQEISGALAGEGVLAEELSFYIRFLDRSGTFDVGDEWQIEIVSAHRGDARSRIGSVRIVG